MTDEGYGSESEQMGDIACPRDGKLPTLQQALGSLASVLHKEKIPYEKIWDLYRAAGVSRTDLTFRRWKSKAALPDEMCEKPEKRGRPAALQPWQVHVILGYILFMNRNGSFVDQTMVWGFTKEKLGADVALSTISRLLHVYRFGSRVAKVSDKKETATVTELARMYRSWLSEHRSNGNLLKSPSQIGSIDCTYTSHRTNMPRTLTQLGG